MPSTPLCATWQANSAAAEVVLGSNATRTTLVSAFGADYVYFFGHCILPWSSPAGGTGTLSAGNGVNNNMLHQGLALGGGDGQSAGISTGPVAATNTKQGEDEVINLDINRLHIDKKPTDADNTNNVFTASDMFTITINTSCLTLITCGSAHEAHTSQGDEPLGLVSAILCAGATSVIGTMWKVQVGTARVFTEVLDRHLNTCVVKTAGMDLVDLAVAVQKTALRLKRRHEGGTRHPYHWAAFVLNGSWFMAARRGKHETEGTVG